VAPLLKPGVGLATEVPEDVGEVQTDKARLRQILVNLLGNAAKFTKAGEVGIRASREPQSDGQVFLVIDVVDTGPGIPAEEQETLFDEFRQLTGAGIRHEDTGLGLSISRRLAELLGGSLTVESEVGVGSTFTVRIPAVYGGPDSDA